MTTRHPYAGDLLARYAKAEDMLRYRTRSLVTAPEVRPTWLPGTETFWYRNRTATGHEFVLVDAEARTRRPAFDHARVARALGTVLDSTPDPADLPFLEIDLRGDRLLVTVAGRRIAVDLLTGQTTGQAEDLGPAHAGEAASPDGRWAVGRQGHDLYLRDLETDQVRRLTTDGERDHGYGTPPDATASSVMQENLDITMPPLVSWAPDSTRFVTHRLDQRDLELMHLVRSVPLDGGRPQLMTYRYSVVGDEPLATAEYYVGDVTAGELSRVDGDPVLMDYVSAIALGFVWWSESGDRAYWLTNVRDGTCASLHELDPDTGAVRLLVEESADTHVLHGPQLYDRNVHVLAGGEVLWWSERTGWGHLYLYRPDGSVDAVTSGDWLVRRVVLVDQERRRVVFTAAGREPGSDLYVQQLYSVSLDGGEVTRITADDLDHDARADRSRSYFVDVASRVDVPAISVLRDRDGAVVLELERADATRLYAAGWTAPERVVVKAADGETDIYCSIFRPHDLDETGSYPILDEIYPGPQISTSPMRFPGSGGVMVAERHAASFAALGFVVVTVDGRGTALRERRFQDHGRLGGHGDYVEDHVAAITQLARTRPWMDVSRVGIYGHSGGGYASTRCLLQAPDFFKAAVSSAGDHTNVWYHAWWGERFYGPADGFDFAGHANSERAGRLRGKLLLIHGGMDDNVTPHLSLGLVDALIEADKDFDLLIVPNADHSMVHQQHYWYRRRWDYLVEHVMGELPPGYRIAEIPIDDETLRELTGV